MICGARIFGSIGKVNSHFDRSQQNWEQHHHVEVAVVHFVSLKPTFPIGQTKLVQDFLRKSEPICKLAADLRNTSKCSTFRLFSFSQIRGLSLM